MSDTGRALVEALHRQAAEEGRAHPAPPPPALQTIPSTELPEPPPGDVLFHAWNCYRREAGRLLAEGHEGKFVLIKGEEIIGLWDTREEAPDVALQRYLLQ